MSSISSYLSPGVGGNSLAYCDMFMYNPVQGYFLDIILKQLHMYNNLIKVICGDIDVFNSFLLYLTQCKVAPGSGYKKSVPAW